MNYPLTKKEAVAYESEQVRWGVPNYIGKVMVDYLKDLGARHEMPESPKGVVEYVNRLHKALSVKNAHMPDDIPFDVIYPPFFSAVMNSKVEMPDFQPWTTKNQLKAFKKWITEQGQLQRLYETYYKQYPDKRPKQLQGKSTKLENWSDEEIESQYEKINLIYDGIIPLPKIKGVDGYFSRIESEYNRRFGS